MFTAGEKCAEPYVRAAENSVEDYMGTGDISARPCRNGCDNLEWRLHKLSRKKAHPTRQTYGSGVDIPYLIPPLVYERYISFQSVSGSVSFPTTIELVGVRGVKRS